MKRLLTIIALCLALSAAAAQKDTLRVLAIGNSFSQDAVEQNLHEIALEDGQEMIIGNMYIGGCSLERHFGNTLNGSRDYQYRKVGTDGVRHNTRGVTLDEALADESWDIVTFQQSSPLSGFTDSYEPYLEGLVKYVRERTRPEVRLMWHQTWAYATGAVHPHFPDYDRDQAKMYRMIMEASGKACVKYGFDVIPTGTAIQNLRKTFSRENCTRDGYHLNNGVGRFTAALTWYEAISGHSVEGGKYKPAVVTDTLAVVARLCAHAAVENPYEVTVLGLEVAPPNYKEENIPEYSLPDALTFSNGKKVRNARQWTQKRRPELFSLFETEMFGKAPGAPAAMSWEELYSDPDALGGLATRREVRVYFDKNRKNYMTLLIYTPNGVRGKVPAFMGINFYGNECTTKEPGILLPEAAKTKAYGIHIPHQRGASAGSWQVETLMRRGYGLVTFCRDDIDPDFDDAFGNGVHPLFYRKGQKFPEPDEWGTIAAWAWGLSRAMDYLETDSIIDATKVAVVGHSRLGKTALWAGACDERIAMAISNDSGCGGAAISRRAVGETVSAINLHFPHWFCANFDKYNDNEAALPFDQHELIALMAPRPVYVASARDDKWSDPVGEQMAATEARKVYALFGKDAVGRIGFHMREGRHAIHTEDWAHYLEFADRYFQPQKPAPVGADVKIVAHRGYHLEPGCPENSITAVRATQRICGAWGSEFDVWMTTDKKIVVNHNPSYGCDPEHRIIKESSYEELKGLRLANGEPIPTLNDFLKAGGVTRGLNMVCELKGHGSLELDKEMFDRVYKTVSGKSMVSQFVFQSFSYDLCLYICGNYPDARVNYICSKEKNVKTPAELKAAGLNGINFKAKIYDAHPEFIEECHRLGLVAGLCAEDDMDVLRKFIKLGIDMIGTNRPVEAAALLAE